MSFVVVIPARYASTRLPGKPLLDIAGKPMLQHVYERALQSDASAVYIATDDERIREAASRFTSNVCMTLSTHQSGTDRIFDSVVDSKIQQKPSHTGNGQSSQNGVLFGPHRWDRINQAQK